jgi:acetolactate synthase I/II/III large subunit
MWRELRQDMNGARRIAERLAAAGIRDAFGIPGGEVLALVEALNEAGIATHLTKHENAAGFMAEGVWHATGAPGLFYATLGPGVANAVNVVANAFQDRVPLIFLTGCVDAAEAESYTHQVFDHQALLRPVVKASFRATAATADLVVDKALRIALGGRPGPVHIDVPISVAEGDAGDGPLTISTAAGPSAPAPGPELDSARAALAASRRPLVLAGLDIVNQSAGEALQAFAEHFQAPVITTYKAKGVIPEDHPLVIGGAGLSPKADKHLLPLFAEADCIVLAGYDPIEMRINWRHPWPADKPVIALSAEDMSHGMHHATHRFTGDVGAGLQALTDKLPLAAVAGRTNWAAGARARMAAAFAPVATWGPDVVFKTIENSVPVDTVATADSGAHRILLSQLWTCRFPRSLLQSSGLCTMGCAVPIAAGFKHARPETPVVAFVGDAGLEMGLGELAAIRDLGIPLIICVLVDGSLALIEMKQRATQRPNAAVEFGGTDFPAVARAMGGHGVWIDDADTLARETRAALGRTTFTVLACRIGKRAYDGLF